MKEKGRQISKGNFSLKRETKTTRQRSSTIKIGLGSERDNIQPSSTGRRDKDVP
jgi:hypothetical protein